MAPKKKQVTESPVKNATSILPVEKAHELAKERANTYFERSQLGSATHATRKSDDATSAPAHWKAALTYELPETASSSVYDLIAKAPPLAAEAPKKRTKAVRGPSSHDPAEQPEDARGGAGVSERSSDLGYFEVDSDEEAEDPKADSNPVILNLLKSQFPQVLLYEPLHFEACVSVIKGAGLKISKKGLAELLDRSGVVYLETTKPRHQYPKPKPKKTATV